MHNNVIIMAPTLNLSYVIEKICVFQSYVNNCGIKWKQIQQRNETH